MSHYDESPVNPLPPVIIVFALAIVLVELVLQLGERGLVGGPEAVGWRLAAVSKFSFVGDVFDQMLAKNIWPLEHLWRFVTYPFVHGSFTQTLFVIVFIVALGKMVGEVFSSLAVLVIFFGSAIAGALVFGLALDDPYPLIGGFPAAYGFIGAYTYLYWLRQVHTGGAQSQAFMLIAFLMGIKLLFGLIFGGSKDWVADIAGFAAGFGLSFVVSPWGWARLMGRIRNR